MRVTDPLKWVAAVFALAATSTAEYEIARAIGMNQFVAVAVPGALDAYVVRALVAHREVLTAVLAMVGVNAASHLVSVGILPVGWQLVTAVAAIAPLVLWRVHALRTPGEVRRRALWGVSAPSTPDTDASTEQDPWLPVADTAGNTIGFVTEESEHTSTDLMAVADAVSAPVPEPEPEPVPEPAPLRLVKTSGTPEYTPVTVQELVSLGVLHPSDTDTYERAREHSAGTDTVPGVRALKSELGTGTARAQRVRAGLVIEHEQRNGKGTS